MGKVFASQGRGHEFRSSASYNQRLSTLLMLPSFNAAPHVVTPTIKSFHCYLLTVILLLYES